MIGNSFMTWQWLGSAAKPKRSYRLKTAEHRFATFQTGNTFANQFGNVTLDDFLMFDQGEAVCAD